MIQEKEPKVSVIMGVYCPENTGDLIRSVRSILNQKEDSLELIIYDDGSEIPVETEIKRVFGDDNRIVILRGEENKGLGAALNACVKVAKGRFIARMDVDDISLPNRIQRQVSYLENNPHIPFVGCGAYISDKGRLRSVWMRPEIPEREDYMRYSPYIHPTVVFRRNIFDKYSYSEAAKCRRCEDYDLFLRLFRDGIRGRNLPFPGLVYKEDYTSYFKRNFHSRIDEAKVRYKNFSALKWIDPIGCLYILRPVLAGILPRRLLYRIRTAKEVEAYGQAN